MKKSEKLFVLINEIDDRFIDSAKETEIKPVEMRPEPRSSLKWFIALAACVAVLAVGVFALVKFKLGSGFDPVQPSPDSSESDSISSDGSSSETSDSSDSSYVDTSTEEFHGSAEDKELYDIVKPLAENASEISGMFSSDYDYGGEAAFVWYDRSDEVQFFPVPKGQRTEPNGLFEIPQTYEGMRELLLTCFTPQAAERFMQYIGKGSLSENSDGTLAVDLEGGYDAEYLMYIEIDGKMYRRYRGSGGKLDMDLQSIKLVSKTDNIINFTCTYTYSNWHETEFTDSEGILANYDGWKLNYHHIGMFLPVFTEQDLELQAILEELGPKAQEIGDWCGSGLPNVNYSDYIQILLPGEKSPREYALMPVGKSDNGIEYPQTCEELKALMLEYFTQEIVDDEMTNARKGTLTENPDGTYTVVNDSESWHYNRTFIETDGGLYVMASYRSGSGKLLWDTAHIIEKTDSRIKFWYINYQMGDYWLEKGLIKYERGGWKLNYGARGFVIDDEPPR